MAKRNFKDTDIQAVIGWILRAGVLASIAIVTFGGIIYLYRHGHTVIDYTVFKGVPGFVHTPAGIWHGIIDFRGRAIIQLGILVLIATPVIRVIVSGIGFLLEKDYLYTAISLLVLSIIVFSALSGHGG